MAARRGQVVDAIIFCTQGIHLQYLVLPSKNFNILLLTDIEIRVCYISLLGKEIYTWSVLNDENFKLL